eukprot:scaffold324628_cov76-Cyclotella_meneghiniana.AAC.2
MQRCANLKRSTVSTVFLFLSPQHLCNVVSARTTLVRCSWNGTLRSIFMDEVHLHVQRGLSFRKECRILRDKFLVMCMHPPNSDYFIPKFVGLSATFPSDYLPGLQILTLLKFDHDSVLRGEMHEFFNTDILMSQVICNKGDYVKRQEGSRRSELESKLNHSSIVCDVIVITGALNKNKKFWRIRIMLGSQNEYVVDCCFRERGRGSRQLGSPSTFVLYVELASYVYLV